MDNKKYEQLINLIINEDREQASELFHEIVVEKSREIYESIMADEEDDGMEGSQVGDLMDEIDAEESGIAEDEEEFADEEVYDLSGDDEEGEEDFGEEGDDEEEEAIIRIEDKLDELLSQFQEIMAGEEGLGDDEEGEEEEVEVDDEEEAMMEAVQLQKVSVTHGDNGAQVKSPVAANSGKAGMGSKPVNFGSADEKGRSAPSAKDVEGASKFKNAPGHRSQDLSSVAKPKHGDNGANNKSPVAK